jgi:hypothetical protein
LNDLSSLIIVQTLRIPDIPFSLGSGTRLVFEVKVLASFGVKGMGENGVFPVKLDDKLANLMSFLTTEKSREPIELDISTMPDGLYFLYILDREETVKKRVVVKH